MNELLKLNEKPYCAMIIPKEIIKEIPTMHTIVKVKDGCE
jgi:hypothetical protein